MRCFRLAVCTLSLVAVLGGAAWGAEWRSLFDGKTLEGWEKHGGAAEYAIENGVIVGHSVPNTRNTFLCSKEKFKDFELVVEVKVDADLNSGIQVRSQIKDDDVVYGPQVEIAWSPDSAGYIYGESTGRGWLTPDAERVEHSHFKNEDWNEYRILCKGQNIKTWLNGKPIADLTDAESDHEGIIGLQVHGVGKRTEPLYVRWRNIKIRELE